MALIPPLVSTVWVLGAFNVGMLSLISTESPKEGEFYGKTKGRLGDVTLGPMGSIGAPHLMGIGVLGKYRDYFAVGFDRRFIPDLLYKDTEFSFGASEGLFRVFPYRGPFYLGAGIGGQSLSVRKEISVQNIPVQVAIAVDTTYVTPRCGWMWQWSSGLFLGAELGWQIAAGTTTTVSTNITNPFLLATSEYEDLEEDVVEAGNELGGTSLPFATFIQVGFLF